jgi:hypothetical protein
MDYYAYVKDLKCTRHLGVQNISIEQPLWPYNINTNTLVSHMSKDRMNARYIILHDK